MNKRYTFKVVLSGVGETVEEAKARAIDGFILDVGEFDVLEVEYLDENYEVIEVGNKDEEEDELDLTVDSDRLMFLQQDMPELFEEN